jgi:DivIVA domain-containing protein
MDQDDPEKRIAELERQLAEAHAAGNPRGGWLTPEQVRNVAFSKPPFGKRGYNANEVNAFLDLVEAALRDPTRRILTAEQVHNKAFSKPPFGKRGYNEDEVDAFLDVVEQQLGLGAGYPQSAASAGQGGPRDFGAVTGGFLTPEQVRNIAFSKPPMGKRGYNEDQVDGFLDLVEAALRGPAQRILTPEQVRNTAFSHPPIGKRGYNQDEVDAFLDLVEQQLGRGAG